MRSALGDGLSLQAIATAYLNGIEPYHYADFINNRMLYASEDVGTVAGGTGYSFTRASEGYYENSDGTLTKFASGALRRGGRGLLIEGARTNLALWSRDFTNAAWVKVNVTPALDQIGVDGTANGASSLTATAGLGTVLQTVVSLSAARATTCYVKRITGTGTIEFTSDGIAYTDITSSLSTGSWFRAVVTGTITNPVIGFRITTSGDAIAVDFAGLESAVFPSSPIATTTASATRAADDLNYTAGVTYPVSLWAEIERVVDASASPVQLGVLQVDASAKAQRAFVAILPTNEFVLRTRGGANDGDVNGATVPLGVATKAVARFEADKMQIAVAGTLATEDTTASVPTSAPDALRVGDVGLASQHLFGYIRRLAIFNTALSDADLQTVTT